MVRSEVTTILNENEGQAQRKEQEQHQIREQMHWQSLLRKLPGWVAAAVAFGIGVYWSLPSWTLSLPSTAYRPSNPFTAVFTIADVGGYIPATDLQIQCFQNLIKYAEPKGTSSANLASESQSFGTFWRNDSRTFQCPQVVAAIEIYSRVLTPEEIRKKYVEGLRILQETGHPPGEDMPFTWVDIEFSVTYRAIKIPFIFQKSYRVIGQPSQNGTFVWEQVALDKVFSRNIK